MEQPGAASVCSNSAIAAGRSPGSRRIEHVPAVTSEVAEHLVGNRAAVHERAVAVDDRDRVGDTRDAGRSSRSSEARTAASASNDSVMSRALMTMPRTAGSSMRLVAAISIQRIAPSARRSRNVVISTEPGSARSRAKTPGGRRDLSGSGEKTSLTRRFATSSAPNPTNSRRSGSCSRTCRPADDHHHVARVLHERSEPHLALEQRSADRFCSVTSARTAIAATTSSGCCAVARARRRRRPVCRRDERTAPDDP